MGRDKHARIEGDRKESLNETCKISEGLGSMKKPAINYTILEEIERIAKWVRTTVINAANPNSYDNLKMLVGIRVISLRYFENSNWSWLMHELILKYSLSLIKRKKKVIWSPHMSSNILFRLYSWVLFGLKLKNQRSRVEG